MKFVQVLIAIIVILYAFNSMTEKDEVKQLPPPVKQAQK